MATDTVIHLRPPLKTNCYGQKLQWTACLDCGKERWVLMVKENPVSIRCQSCSKIGHPHHAFSLESLEKIRVAKLGSNNPMWRGIEVGRIALHERIRKEKPKSLFCEQCGEKPPADLSSVGDLYSHDIKDWQWLCRSCHVHNDGRIYNLLNQ